MEEQVKQEQKEQKEQKYRTWPVVRRLVREMRQADGRQAGRVAAYTVCSGLYPFLAILLPKLAIGILEREGADAMKRLLPVLGVYFLAAALLGYAARRIESMIWSKNMRRRIFYVVEMGDKLTGMDLSLIHI